MRKETKYPKWFNKAYSEAEYWFEHSAIDGSGMRVKNAFNNPYVKRKVWDFYRYYSGKSRIPVFIWEREKKVAPKARYNKDGEFTGWAGLKKGFCHVVAGAMNGEFWGKAEYEKWGVDKDGNEYKIANSEKNGIPYSGFYATPDDKELSRAWDNTFCWFMDEPWINLPGHTWEVHRIEQL